MYFLRIFLFVTSKSFYQLSKEYFFSNLSLDRQNKTVLLCFFNYNEF